MTSRFLGLAPAFALLAVGVAHAQVTNQTGSMAYPQSLPSGQVQLQAPTARDTGNMAYPASPGGVSERAPQGADTGNMATPTGRSALNTRRAAAPTRMAAGDPANSMRPDVAPTPAQTAQARALDAAPSAAPVPYTDFLPPARPMAKGGRGAVHHAVMRKPMKAATKAATPAAASAPAAAPAATPPAAATKYEDCASCTNSF